MVYSSFGVQSLYLVEPKFFIITHTPSTSDACETCPIRREAYYQSSSLIVREIRLYGYMFLRYIYCEMYRGAVQEFFPPRISVLKAVLGRASVRSTSMRYTSIRCRPMRCSFITLGFSCKNTRPLDNAVPSCDVSSCCRRLARGGTYAQDTT
jgi:hypothetical protein